MEPCRLCLSTQRAVSSVADMLWAYHMLTDTGGVKHSDDSSEATALVCWECHSVLRRLVRFKEQARRAQVALAAHSRSTDGSPLKCLSNLASFTKTYYDADLSHNLDYSAVDLGVDVKMLSVEVEIKNEIGNEDEMEGDVFAEPMSPGDYAVKCDTEIKPETTTEAAMVKDIPAKGDKTTDKVKSKTKPARRKVSREKINKSHALETNENNREILDRAIDKFDSTECNDAYRCTQCDATFKSEEEHHLNGTCAALRCRLCAHVAADAAALRRHRDAEHARAPRRPEPLKMSQFFDEESSTYKCDHCGLQVKTISYFRKHYKSHVEPQTYECHLCGASYALRTQIILHLSRHDKRFLCEYCGMRFARMPPLKIHYLSHSTIDARPHACDHCPRRFITKDKLIAHVRIHEGLKPFKCDMCHLEFRMKFDLTRHKKVRHKLGDPTKSRKFTGRTKSLCVNKKISSEKKYRTKRLTEAKCKTKDSKDAEIKYFYCKTCPNKFTSKIGLASHMVVHTGERPHKCDECELTFKFTSGLWSHKLLHRGVKAHQCTVCGAQFTLKGNLKGHMKIHNDDKPYECDICGQRFPWRRNLRNHMKVHSKR